MEKLISHIQKAHQMRKEEKSIEEISSFFRYENLSETKHGLPRRRNACAQATDSRGLYTAVDRNAECVSVYCHSRLALAQADGAG